MVEIFLYASITDRHELLSIMCITRLINFFQNLNLKNLMIPKSRGFITPVVFYGKKTPFTLLYKKETL